MSSRQKFLLFFVYMIVVFLLLYVGFKRKEAKEVDNQAVSNSEESVDTESKNEEEIPQSDLNIDVEKMNSEEKEAKMAEVLKKKPFQEMSTEDKAKEKEQADKMLNDTSKAVFLNVAFKKKVHDVSGSVKNMGDKLIFSEDFKVDAGPDLHVFISGASNPSNSKELHDKGAIDLGKLKSTFGTQIYDLPKNREFPIGSIVIYCVPFKVIFALAEVPQGK